MGFIILLKERRVKEVLGGHFLQGDKQSLCEALPLCGHFPFFIFHLTAVENSSRWILQES